jgi:alanine dehydrogenase
MLVLSRPEVEATLDLDLLIEALVDGFIAVSKGEASVPPRVAAFTPNDGFLAAMPGYISGTLVTKLVSVFPHNHDKGLPSHQAMIALFDADTGTPLALMDGTYITAMRTAAAAALATRTLARDDARVLTVIGAGVQGRSHLQMVPTVRTFEEVRVASRSPESARSLASEFDARVAGSFESAVAGADVVCLCTDANAPVIDGRWLAPGTHVTSVGASPQGGELDERTVRAGLLVVESRVAFQAPPAGSAELQGMDPGDAAELGEVLAGTHPGRVSPEQITVYKSMGHAMEDATAARLVYERALADGKGTELPL